MLGGETGKITFVKLSVNLGLRAERISSLYNILVALGSAQPLTEMSARLFPVVKAAGV